jgi:enediyne biosynthesis protein E4
MSPFLGRFLAVVFLLLLLGGVLLFLARKRAGPGRTGAGDLTSLVSDEVVTQFTALEAREAELDRTVWAKEILAEKCGGTFESLWDSLNAATNKFDVLAAFPVQELVVGRFGPPRKPGHGIVLHEPDGAGPAWSEQQWREVLGQSQRAGWDLAQIEFRHNRFETDDLGRPRESRFSFAANLINRASADRAALEGELIVEWAPGHSGDEPAAIRRIDASRVSIKVRPGEAPFRSILVEEIAPPQKSYFIDPLILYDLDGDGLSEIVLAARNLVYRRGSGDHYEAEPLCRYPPGLILTGIVADFDGDGVADFLCAKFEGLMLFKGSPGGRFDQPGRLVWPANPHLKYAQALTCGDIDHDGDLDLFLGQYKVPYTRGQMAAPYYDANDGNPAYLLLNDGHGNFTDATVSAGLEKKRWRRTYSASLADLNNDGHLDLVVVSDFAGLDLYRNDGRGHFVDVTRDAIAESHAFGMAHALADFDADGRLDLLMIGMNSPTVERLEYLGLRRREPGAWNTPSPFLPAPSNGATPSPDGRGESAKEVAGLSKTLARPGEPTADNDDMRSRMTSGNRLYLAGPEGGFKQTSLNDAIARTGWSWGCSAFDFDNDGYPDLYIANGHETKQTVRDYDTEFWLHDIYVGNSKDNIVASAYFTTRFGRTRARGWSYGGRERNRLYLNQQGQSFVEAGHLMAVALEEDSRDVVADDLDGDGRMDLLVTTFEAWPRVKQTLRVFKNTLDDGGNWIGFRLREQVGLSPVGARVTLRYPGGMMVRQMITGDSYRSQHANTVHFGLGKIERVERAEVRWVNGHSLVLDQPAINRYHFVQAPEAKSAARR